MVLVVVKFEYKVNLVSVVGDWFGILINTKRPEMDKIEKKSSGPRPSHMGRCGTGPRPSSMRRIRWLILYKGILNTQWPRKMMVTKK